MQVCCKQWRWDIWRPRLLPDRPPLSLRSVNLFCLHDKRNWLKSAAVWTDSCHSEWRLSPGIITWAITAFCKTNSLLGCLAALFVPEKSKWMLEDADIIRAEQRGCGQVGDWIICRTLSIFLLTYILYTHPPPPHTHKYTPLDCGRK